MTLPIVLYDACVLYPAALRDLLVQLALSGIFKGRWTERIHDEWTRNVIKNRPDLHPQQIQRTRELMNRSVRDCLITGYESIEASLLLPDMDDCHVLAAAIHGDAEAIITFNLSDFPATILQEYDILALHPDDFLLDLLNKYPVVVMGAIKSCRARLRNPPKSLSEYLDTLIQQGLNQSVARLRESRSNP